MRSYVREYSDYFFPLLVAIKNHKSHSILLAHNLGPLVEAAGKAQGTTARRYSLTENGAACRVSTARGARGARSVWCARLEHSPGRLRCAPPTAKERTARTPPRRPRPREQSRAWVARRGGVGAVADAGARLSCYLHALAELADLAVDHVALLLRDVRLLEHLRRLRDRLLCNGPVCVKSNANGHWPYGILPCKTVNPVQRV